MTKSIFLFTFLSSLFCTVLSQKNYDLHYKSEGKLFQRKIITLNPSVKNDKVIHKQNGYLFELFPNPNESIVALQLDPEFLKYESIDCTLYDMFGSQLDFYTQTSGRIIVNLSAFKPGSYLLVLTAGKNFRAEWQINKRKRFK